ncbi:MAG: hypothetical protein ACFFCQ_04915 [Promethearchaeota archaeon]
MFKGLRRKKKFKKFAQEVQDATEHREDIIYIIGFNIYAERFCNRLIELGAENRLAVISSKARLWMEDLPETIKVLIEEQEEEFLKRSMYENIGFSNAEKVVVLIEDAKMIQAILDHVRSQTDAEIILLDRFAPQFVKYIARTQKDARVRIVEDVRTITRQLLEMFEADISFPPVYSIPVEKDWEGLTVADLRIPGCVILKIERVEDDKTKYISPENEKLQNGDKIVLYITKDGSMRTLVSTLSQLSIAKEPENLSEEATI